MRITAYRDGPLLVRENAALQLRRVGVAAAARWLSDAFGG